MPSHQERVRANYVCPLCGCSTLDGEHGVFRFSEDRESILVCLPRLICHNPRRLGIITDIAGPGE